MPEPGETPQHSVSVAGVIVDYAGRMLAIKRADNGHWEPPGGVLELGETIEEGLVREIREETGLTVEPGRLTGVYKNMNRGIVALVFRCRLVGGDARGTAEARELAWLTSGEVAERMTEAYRVRMLDALSAGDPVLRAHDGERILG